MMITIREAPMRSSGSEKPPSSRSAPRSTPTRRLRGDRAHIARLGKVGAHGGDVVAVRDAVAAGVVVRRSGVARHVVALRVLDAVAVDPVEGDRVAACGRGPGE